MEELKNIQSFTVKEFQENFDSLMERVENGESFIIKDGKKGVIIVPFRETIKYALDSLNENIDSEISIIYNEHEKRV